MLLGLLLILAASPGLAQQDVPYVQTDWAVVDSMLALARPQKGEKIYDLGCGDGRIVIRAAKVYGARGVGIDSNPVRIEESWAAAKRERVDHLVDFAVQDIFEADFSDADIVTMYLLQWVNLKLRPMLFRDLKPGTRIVSHAWSMGEWMPDRQIKVVRADGRGESYVHFWIVPANVSGEWTWTRPAAGGKQSCRLGVTQEFQNVYGTFTAEGAPIAIEDMRLSGDRLHFSCIEADGAVSAFDGIVNGDTIRGTCATAGDTLKWQAKRTPKTSFPLDREGPLRVRY